MQLTRRIPLSTEFWGEMDSVAVSDVRVSLHERRDLVVRVEGNAEWSYCTRSGYLLWGKGSEYIIPMSGSIQSIIPMSGSIQSIIPMSGSIQSIIPMHA